VRRKWFVFVGGESRTYRDREVDCFWNRRQSDAFGVGGGLASVRRDAGGAPRLSFLGGLARACGGNRMKRPSKKTVVEKYVFRSSVRRKTNRPRAAREYTRAAPLSCSEEPGRTFFAGPTGRTCGAAAAQGEASVDVAFDKAFVEEVFADGALGLVGGGAGGLGLGPSREP